MIHIIGLDLSLARPGAVAIPVNWRPGDWKRVKTSFLKTKDPKSTADQEGQLRRYKQITDWACSFVSGFLATGCTAQVFIEDYGFSKNNKGSSRIMESGGIVRWHLWSIYNLTTRNVTASEARKLLLGFNPQKRQKTDPEAKTVVQDWVFNKAGAPKTWDENEVDAFVVANFGMGEAGGKVLSLA